MQIICEGYLPIKGYEGRYLVNENGEVWSRRLRGPMKPWYTLGYLYVGLCKNGVCNKKRVHRLVAEAFVSNPLAKPEINHINGIKDDNRSENLEWCESSDNKLHAYAIGLRTDRVTAIAAMRKAVIKLSGDQVVAMRALVQSGDMTLKKIAVEFGVSVYTVIRVKYRREAYQEVA